MEQAELSDGLGIVINFYIGSPDAGSHRVIVSATEVSLRLLTLSPAVDAVILVDGSEAPCEPMRDVCETLRIQYHHANRRLNYVESYNVGWQKLPYTYVGLMANDVIPFPLETMDKLLAWVKQPDVGCTFPYMSTNRDRWDEVQRPGIATMGIPTCEPTTMTLNLNLFKRSVLEAIGGLDPRYTAGFQEPILIVKIRTLGYRVVLVGLTKVFHFDGLTKISGQSMIVDRDHKDDRDLWFKEFADYASQRGLAQTRTWATPFATSWLSQIVWWLVSLVPLSRLRYGCIAVTLWIEPWLCRYPARMGCMKQSST